MKATELLREQHDDAAWQLHRLRSGSAPEPLEALARLAALLRANLTVEEELFYPELAREAPPRRPIVHQWFDDHRRISETLAAIERIGPDDPDAPVLLEELDRLLHEHIENEESIALAAAEAWPEGRLDDLGRRMAARFEQLVARALEEARAG